jgi:hypothetical protein
MALTISDNAMTGDRTPTPRAVHEQPVGSVLAPRPVP